MKKIIGFIGMFLAVFLIIPGIIVLSVSGSTVNAEGKTGTSKNGILISSDKQTALGRTAVDFQNGTYTQLNKINGPKKTASSGISSEDIENVKIKVYFADEDVTKEIGLEEYITGVVLGEMLISFDKEALKAQAVAARSYTLYMLTHGGENYHKDGAIICTDYTHCQTWKSTDAIFRDYPEEQAQQYYDKLISAIKETRQVIMTYEGEIVQAYYFSNSGGFTETYENVWGGDSLEYIQSVPCIGEADKENFCTLDYFTPEDFLERFKCANENVKADAENVYDTIKVVSRNSSNRIDILSVGGVEFKGTDVRSILGLKSTNIVFRELDDGRILTVTFGYGHGVGMSQWGAGEMAKNGSSYQEILNYYYKGVTIEWVDTEALLK